MRTLFALHCITKRNINDKFFDRELKELGYDESLLASDELPSEIDIAQGQIDEPLNEKGKVQAKFLGKQVAAQRFKIKNIYCAKQIRCQETARIIARQLKYPVNIIVDQRLNARSYGIIAERGMDSDKLKHFWKHDIDFETLKIIAAYLLAPEKIGAEPKDKFKARVRDFIKDPNYDFDDSLIIAGSDFWKQYKKDNYFYKYQGEQGSDLRRGQLALIDPTKEKESKLRQAKEAKQHDLGR